MYEIASEIWLKVIFWNNFIHIFLRVIIVDDFSLDELWNIWFSISLIDWFEHMIDIV